MTIFMSPCTTTGRLVLLLALLTGSFSLTARAQMSADPFEEDGPLKEAISARHSVVDPLAPFAHKTPIWWNRLDEQLAHSLASRTGDVREKALQVTASFGRLYGAKIDFAKCVPELVRTFESSRDERHRMMALSALHAIGDPYGMQRLRELVSEEPSERLRRLTYKALAQYDATH